jgi:hypothetical protein
VISGLTYWDAHQADRLAAQALQATEQRAVETYALKVSYSFEGSTAGGYFLDKTTSGDMEIDNLSKANVFDVIVRIDSIVPVIPPPWGNLTVSVGRGDIPPCSIATASIVSILNAARRALVGYDPSLPSTTGSPAPTFAGEPTSLAEANSRVKRFFSWAYPVVISGIWFADTNGAEWFRDSGGILSPSKIPNRYGGYDIAVPFQSIRNSSSCS